MIQSPVIEMKLLADLLEQNESWLMERILYYAKQHDYAKYTSTLQESWRISINGLSEAIIKAISTYHSRIPQFCPDDDLKNDPVTEFGLIEAKKHRERGIRIDMFLGLLKYYRQTYEDLVENSDTPHKSHFKLFVIRCFDRFELALCSQWVALNEDNRIVELQNKNRVMTNEKNKYLTLFESISEPAILLDSDNRIENLNHSAASLFGFQGGTGKYYYHEKSTLDDTETYKVPAKDALPWLAEDLIKFSISKDLTRRFEKSTVMNDSEKYFEVYLSKMMDISGKFSGIIVVLIDITPKKIAEKIKIEKERLQGVLEMAGAVCHELNQPLQSIEGYIELLLMKVSDRDESFKKLTEIHSQVERIGVLTQRLLKIARYETREYIRGKKIIDLDKSTDL